MTARGYFRGHPIYWADNEWRFTDTNETTIGNWANRPCGHCGLDATPEGHDGCLGTLPDVMNACCGHGQVAEAYIQFPDGRIERGQAAIDLIHTMTEELQ